MIQGPQSVKLISVQYFATTKPFIYLQLYENLIIITLHKRK